MGRFALVVLVVAIAASFVLAQQTPPAQSSDRSREAEESSSRDTRIDISPPKDDAKKHPDSASAVEDLTADDNPANSDVQEFHPWNPMKAVKDIEVGDFYFKRKNYRAALIATKKLSTTRKRTRSQPTALRSVKRKSEPKKTQKNTTRAT